MSDTINKKQKLLIEYMIAKKEVFARCFRILKPEYFEPPLDRVVETIMAYFIKHHASPSVDLIEAETGILLLAREVEDHEINYLLEEIEEHCQTEAMAIAVLESADRVASGDRNSIDSLIREALLVRIDSDLGLDFYDDPEERIRLMEDNVVNYSSGIPELDNMVGSVHKGELGLVYAVTSGGKSLMMANMGIALAKQQLDVVIITLEMNEFISAKRMDVMVTGEDIRNHGESASIIAGKIAEQKEKHNMGSIIIKQMIPHKTTAATLRAYLMEYNIIHGKFPDAVIVDYLKLLGVDDSVRGNISEQDDEKSIRLRAMAVEYDMIMISAGQINREGQDVMELSPAHVQGGIVVVNNSDWSIALVASEEDIENSQVQMRALKQRNAEKTAKNITLYRCPRSLRFAGTPFINTSTNQSPLVRKREEKESKAVTEKPKSGKKAKEKIQPINLKETSGRDRLKAALNMKRL